MKLTNEAIDELFFHFGMKLTNEAIDELPKEGLRSFLHNLKGHKRVKIEYFATFDNFLDISDGESLKINVKVKKIHFEPLRYIWNSISEME